VHDYRYAEAWEAFARLSSEERARPEVRLARARAGIKLGRAAEALSDLEALEGAVPSLKELIEPWRAEAWWSAGMYERAAAYFASRSDARSWLRAAEAFEKVANLTQATSFLDRAIASKKLSRHDEERARLSRMQFARKSEASPAVALDAEWLAVHALHSETAAEALALLERLTPPRRLAARDWLARAELLADAGKAEDALSAFEEASKLGRGVVSPKQSREQCRLFASILWRARTKYREAATAYARCAELGGERVAEHRFLSARAWLRADHDTEALAGFREILERYPRTVWAEQAEFLSARYHALSGHWKEAVAQLSAYLRHVPKGKDRGEAERYLALSQLMDNQGKAARRAFEELARRSSDPMTQRSMMNLAALASARAGDEAFAIARWTELARTRPLTYAGLIARAHLEERGAAIPALVEPTSSQFRGQKALPIAVLPGDLPQPIELLMRAGLADEAEASLSRQETALIARVPSGPNEALCVAYGQLDRAKRRLKVSLATSSALLAEWPTSSESVVRQAWECAFPMPYANLVREASSDARVEPELLWSVMKQESGFDAAAFSPAGAVGLMQLMPATARKTAEAHGIEHDDAQLTHPAYSIRVGALYLREVLDAMKGHLPLAIASYNAGPEALRRWLDHTQGAPLDVFLEAIPFLETRGYVVRVLTNLARYGYLAKGEAGLPRLTLDLTALKPPR
jgi:soluble lytic murein transglycosylase